VRIPLPLAPLTAFHKIAKRRFDDISSVAVAFALDVRDGVVVDVAIGLGGVAATPVRATATEAALRGRPWDADTVREAAAVLAPRAPHRRPPGQRRLPGGDARTVSAQVLHAEVSA
jgi:xanthine dehydrogenase small subunit